MAPHKHKSSEWQAFQADTKNTDTQNKHLTTAEGHSLNLQEAIESVQNKIPMECFQCF